MHAPQFNEQPKPKPIFIPGDFVAWWNRHPDSKYCVHPEDGKVGYSIRPHLAWQCNRYREEFSAAYPEYPYKWQLKEGKN